MTRLRLALIVWALGACGRIGFDDRAGDGGRDGITGEAAIDARASFGTPVRVVSDPVLLVTNPTVREDELEMFVIRRDGVGMQGDIFVTKRATTTDAFGPLTAVTELNTGGDESGLHLARNGLVIWFSSIRAGNLGGHDIFRAVRPSPTVPFAAPVRVDGISTTGDESSPAPDVVELYLILNVDPAPKHLYASARAAADAMWPPPQLVVELATAFEESGPELSADGLTLYFESDRPGLGGFDLYVTHRATPASAYGPPALVTELSGAANDLLPWISADERVIYFTSNREGRDAIYRAER